MKRIKNTVILFFVYFLTAIPFKVMEIIPGFTDIRPVAMLGPIYAVFFGIPGCIIMAVGNIVMDIFSNSLRWTSIAGFIANFIGPLLIYLIWIRWSRKPFSLKTGSSLLKHVGIIILSAVLETAIISPAVALIYPSVDASLFALSVLLNNTIFPIVFGIPITILIQEELGFEPIGFKELRK